MKRLRNPRTGIDQGDLVVFSEFDSGGSMWTGEGARELRMKLRAALSAVPARHSAEQARRTRAAEQWRR